MTRSPYAIAAVALAAVAIAGCGSGSKSSYAGSGPSGKSGATAATGPVSVKKISIGSVLADSGGRTLYVFAKDTKNHSNCSGACAQTWPPAASAGSSPKAGKGVTKSKLTAIKRSDGTLQLAYAGQPLYRYTGDSSTGDANGQGLNTFGGLWYVVSASGAPVKSGGGGGNSGGASPGGY